MNKRFKIIFVLCHFGLDSIWPFFLLVSNQTNNDWFILFNGKPTKLITNLFFCWIDLVHQFNLTGCFDFYPYNCNFSFTFCYFLLKLMAKNYLNNYFWQDYVYYQNSIYLLNRSLSVLKCTSLANSVFNACFHTKGNDNLSR